MSSPNIWLFIALFSVQQSFILSLDCYFCRQSQAISKAPFRCAANATNTIQCAPGIRYCETRISADLNVNGNFYVEKLCGKTPDEKLTLHRVYGQNCTQSVVYDGTANGGARLSKRQCFCESDHCNGDRDVKMASKSAARIPAGAFCLVIAISVAKLFYLL